VVFQAPPIKKKRKEKKRKEKKITEIWPAIARLPFYTANNNVQI